MLDQKFYTTIEKKNTFFKSFQLFSYSQKLSTWTLYFSTEHHNSPYTVTTDIPVERLGLKHTNNYTNQCPNKFFSLFTNISNRQPDHYGWFQK